MHNEPIRLGILAMVKPASGRQLSCPSRFDEALPVWYLAHDADPAGDRAAAGWPARAVRVRPPVGKDWTESAQYGEHLGHKGVDLARWWRDRLGGVENPELFTWDELSTWRWGDGRELRNIEKTRKKPMLGPISVV